MPRSVVLAKSEQAAEPIELVYGDETFKIPGSMPLEAIEAMEGEQRIMAFLKIIFGPVQWKRFVKVFDTQDLEALADAVSEIYGSTLGESQASGSS
jgi:hypothetical protein